MKIEINLSTADIQKTINQLEAYRGNLVKKSQELRDRIAKEIAKQAQAGFNSAIVDDTTDKGQSKPDVNVYLSKNGNITSVIAKGEDAIWVEFGAGIYHNTPVGTSPHPRGRELGMTIGSFGKGKGAKETWGYYDGEEIVLTHGTPAAFPMYNAAKEACDAIRVIAKEVFR